MGVFAQTSATINCANKEATKHVVKKLRYLKKASTDGNFQFSRITVWNSQVSFDHQSGRVQNLEWQLEEVWNAIKFLPGVEYLHAPFEVEDGEGGMAEDDGVFFENKA